MKKDWQTKKIGEVCEFFRGLTYSKKDEVNFSSNIVLRATNIDLNNNCLNFSELRYINEKITIPENKKAKKGSLIICTASGSKKHLGKVALIDNEINYAFGGFLGQLTPKNNLIPKYFFYNLISKNYKKFIEKLSIGVNINNLRFNDLKNFEIPLPPLPEQRRIVGILDGVFENIEKAKEDTKKNLKNAKELFQSYLQRVFENPKNDWQTKKLGEICDFKGGSQPPKINFIHKPKKNYVRFLQIRDFRSNKNIIYIPKNKKNRLCNENDILIGRYGASVGKILINKKGAYNVAIMKTIPNLDILHNKYLYYYLLSNKFQKRLNKVASRSAQAGFSKNNIHDFPIVIPPLSEQKQIVGRLDRLSEEVKKLEQDYQQKLDNLEELKKSILKQAFNGDL